jgi:hypothetical protein
MHFAKELTRFCVGLQPFFDFFSDQPGTLIIEMHPIRYQVIAIPVGKRIVVNMKKTALCHKFAGHQHKVNVGFPFGFGAGGFQVFYLTLE